jgi:hypothetical protein
MEPELPEESVGPGVGWGGNYFNYFTEIEEHFQKARGTSLFLLSPLDWALIEAWKNAGVPLEAVLRGIDEAFAKWRSRRSKVRAVNSLTYCAQAVLTEAERMARNAGSAAKPVQEASAPFEMEELRRYLTENAAQLREAGEPLFDEIAISLERFAAEAESHLGDLQALEQRLTALEEKMVAGARAAQSDEELFQARRQLESQLSAYRSKMSAEQISMLERQFLDRHLLETKRLPRLSLFYLR